MHFASAITTQRNTSDAVRSLVNDVRAEMKGRAIDVALLFLSPHFAHLTAEITDHLRAALNPRLLLGCTAEGVIGRDQEIEREPAITLTAAHMPNVELVSFVLDPAQLPQTLASRETFARAVAAPEATQLFIMVADPFSTPMDAVLEAFNTYYAGIPMIGGMASGSGFPGGNVLFLNTRTFTRGAVGVALSGAFEVDVIVSQGCRPIGRTYTITGARENVILSLEGQPPLARIQEIVAELPEEDRALLRNGLFVGRAIDPWKDVLGPGDFLIRGVIGIDPRSGIIAVGDYVREGEIIQFHLRDAVTAAEDLALMLTPQVFSDPPRGALLFSCNGRGIRLYGHPNGDISIIQKYLGGVHIAGFFCAGEIGPVGGRNFLHGHTASLVLFRPREA